MDSIAVCAIFKDEAPYLLEWIAFHKVIGVNHFVLYDNESADGGAALIRRSKFARDVTLIDWPQRPGQLPAYADFIANHARRFDWAAFIDVDEFIHPLEADTIQDLLPLYDAFSGVLLHWMMFGSSGHRTRPAGLVPSSYTHRIPTDSKVNGHVKSLARVRDLKGIQTTPHIFSTAGDCCNARGEKVLSYALQEHVCHDVMVINHYFTKSFEEWKSKALRGRADTTETYTDADRRFHDLESGATVEDRRILRFVPHLQRELLNPVVVAPAAVPRVVAPPVRGLQLGIGIVTYNRKDIVAETIDRVLRHTKYPFTEIAVADDGSTDGTLEMLRARQVTTVTGRNTGIAWNKNRALFALAELLRCDVVVLLEDDSFPIRDGWEIEWINAAIRWGHATVAGDWLRSHFISGSGTFEDPIRSTHITGQCAVFSREALLFGGYFDSRFRGYGHEHVEHSRRMVRMGYGGVDEVVSGTLTTVYKLLWGGIGFNSTAGTFYNREQVERNFATAQSILWDFSYRAPWSNEQEAKQFHGEMRSSFPRTLL